jgi:glycosyltransferase involved in cell wall biosynthesis
MVNKFLYPKGGAETYMLELGQHFVNRGHEIQYFGMYDSRNIVGNSVDAYTKNIDFHDSSLYEKLSYPFRIIYSKEAREKIRIVLDDFNPEVVHLNNFNYQLTPSIILEIRKWSEKLNKSCKIIYTAHDPQLVCPNHMLFNPNTLEVCEKCLRGNYFNCILRRCIHGSTVRSFFGTLESFFWKIKGTYKHIDKIICCSHFMKSKIDSNEKLSKKTIALHNYINNAKTIVYSKKDYVLYFGRYSYEKGIKTLLKVCSELPDMKFIFAGSGPLEDEINGIDNIENKGFQKGDDLIKLIGEARFSVYPSEWYENCPFSILESITYKTPVLGSNIGGIPELIEEDKTGRLFPSGDAYELKNMIQSLWNDKELTNSYSENCDNVKFDTIDDYYEKLIEIYIS